VTPPRLFLDSCVLIEGILSPWSSSRGVLISGRASLFTFVLAEIVIEETERALTLKLGRQYPGKSIPSQDLALLLKRLNIERAPHVSLARGIRESPNVDSTPERRSCHCGGPESEARLVADNKYQTLRRNCDKAHGVANRHPGGTS
jgi:hypothetical protein